MAPSCTLFTKPITLLPQLNPSGGTQLARFPRGLCGGLFDEVCEEEDCAEDESGWVGLFSMIKGQAQTVIHVTLTVHNNQEKRSWDNVTTKHNTVQGTHKSQQIKDGKISTCQSNDSNTE